ncbi:MAG: hypothetical protein HWE10_13620 [Gammaproteobacteria bacterium]|nr:hypothetical protein [Gammaproteobacteria bacterium]
MPINELDKANAILRELEQFIISNLFYSRENRNFFKSCKICFDMDDDSLFSRFLIIFYYKAFNKEPNFLDVVSRTGLDREDSYNYLLEAITLNSVTLDVFEFDKLVNDYKIKLKLHKLMMKVWKLLLTKNTVNESEIDNIESLAFTISQQFTKKINLSETKVGNIWAVDGNELKLENVLSKYLAKYNEKFIFIELSKKAPISEDNRVLTLNGRCSGNRMRNDIRANMRDYYQDGIRAIFVKGLDNQNNRYPFRDINGEDYLELFSDLSLELEMPVYIGLPESMPISVKKLIRTRVNVFSASKLNTI